MSSFGGPGSPIYGKIGGILREGAEMNLAIGTDWNFSKFRVASSFKFETP
jgi:hypothetical protein